MAEGPVAGLSEHSGGDSGSTERRRGSCPFKRCWSRGAALRPKSNGQAMQVHVETYVDEGGFEKLRRFHVDGRVVEVADNIDDVARH